MPNTPAANAAPARTVADSALPNGPALSTEDKRALQILRLVTELTEQSASERADILELREANTRLVLENGRLMDLLAVGAR